MSLAHQVHQKDRKKHQSDVASLFLTAVLIAICLAVHDTFLAEDAADMQVGLINAACDDADEVLLVLLRLFASRPAPPPSSSTATSSPPPKANVRFHADADLQVSKEVQQR